MGVKGSQELKNEGNEGQGVVSGGNREDTMGTCEETFLGDLSSLTNPLKSSGNPSRKTGVGEKARGEGNIATVQIHREPGGDQGGGSTN